jgi:outer membrane protein insertion porin family
MHKIKIIVLFSLTVMWSSMLAAETFKVEDIRIEGLQRISAGTVFTALPLSVNDEVDQRDLRRAMRALFGTGNFENIQIGRDENVLVVMVVERPSISEINIEGNKAIATEALLEGLKSSGLAEGQVFKRATLEGIRLELQRQYVSQGRYDAEIEAEVVEQPRNRVAVNINVDEGSVAKIKHINVVGNKAYSNDVLLDLFELQSTGWFSFISGDDKYSKEKLKGDLERLESFYLDRGYIKFNIDSTQVAIGPNKDSVYITVNITEGDIYTINNVELSGDIILEEALLRRFLLVREGQRFSQQLITTTEEIVVKRLGNDGYTFAKVNGIPEVDDEKKTVDIRFFVDPGKRTYVRRINFRGNTKTIDEVLRREMRQMEAAPAASQNIEQSRVRLERLGFFKEVQVDTLGVPGHDDLIDVNYTVEEQHSGSIGASIGYADGSGMIIGANLQQSNFLGSGKQIGVSVNTSKYQTSYRLSFLNPYYTEDGVSRGFSIFYSKVDAEELNISSYRTNTFGANMSFGYPLSEIERLGFSIGYTHTEVKTGYYVVQEIKSGPLPVNDLWQYVEREFDENGKWQLPDDPEELRPEQIFDILEGDNRYYANPEDGFIDRYGNEYDNYNLTASWTRSTLNRGRLATRGASQSVALEITVPGSDLEFLKLTYSGQIFFPLTRSLTLRLRTELGYGEGYGKTDELPFYKNFYAGGFGSVRGYESRTLGPRSTNPAYYNTSNRVVDAMIANDGSIIPQYGNEPVYQLDKDKRKFASSLYLGEADPFGGNVSVEGSAEILFPLPFVKDQRSVRTAFFLDAGNVFDSDCSARQKENGCDNLDLSQLSYSFGVGLTWITAMGPLTFSLAKPFHYEDYVDTKTFQFSLGTGF